MDLDTINEYIFIKHNIFPGTQRKDIVDVARNHLGLHSARIMTPYTTLCSRINGYNTKMLTSVLVLGFVENFRLLNEDISA